jgi:exonuclease SbcD
MIILHTADLHLIEENDERWKAFKIYLDEATNHEAEIVVISGDIFDTEADAEALRAPMRSLFEGVEYNTLIIPGNHDAEAFRVGLYFGEEIQVFNDPDWAKNVCDRDEVRFIGLPFEPMEADQFHRRLRVLREVIDPDKSNILLYHGELLDASFDREAFGVERGRYMPSRLAYFAELGVDYVLAGHFHTNFDVRGFGEGGFFIYPGSPVSITQREVGVRHAALIELGQAPRQIPLNTHHFERVEVMLDAFADEDPIEVIEARLADIHPAATVLLTVDGTIRGSEQELAQVIRALTAEMPVEERNLDFRDLSHIVQHPVYGLFEARLEELRQADEEPLGEEDAQALRQILIRAMVEAGV